MATHYQISPTATLVKDMIFGWVIRTEDRLVFFSDCDNLQLRKLREMFTGNAIYNDLCGDITKLIAANANKKKRAAVTASLEAAGSPPQHQRINEFTGIRERLDAAFAEDINRLIATNDEKQAAVTANLQAAGSPPQHRRINEIMGIKSVIDGQLDAGSNPAVLANEKGYVYARVVKQVHTEQSMPADTLQVVETYQVVDAINDRVLCEGGSTYDAAAYIAARWW